ncbi:MAG TPA: MXAN_2562 family outer membrane beta-barrel protein [Polyangiaceae bacterium]|nr:MXAN_2562 family outer membrane beta-barrel protein [Polyangiaceae bacterium]
MIASRRTSASARSGARRPLLRQAAHALAASAFAAIAWAPASASAQDDKPPVVVREEVSANDDVSPQNAAFELRFGPYSPKIDDNLATPVYEDFFGDSNRYMFGFELDWQAWRAPYVGTLGLGIGWGYTQMAGTNEVEFTPTGETPPAVSQESTLNIMPVYGVGVLRVDTFSRNFHVPIVPYAKFGLSWAFWWVNDGIGTATNDAGEKGRDVSVGYQASIGGMFLLDILEPSAALAADVDGGVNNSYLFFEWSMSNYGGDQMNVGSNNWVTGLAFEM